MRKLFVDSVADVAAALRLGFVARPRAQPVRLLTSAVRHAVEAKDFHPVTIDATGEMKTLASWVNELLRMVAVMRERQTRLILDTSHELRNPLTSLRTNLDLLAVDLRRDQLSPDQRTEVVTDVLAQVVELSGLVSDLARRARDDDEPRLEPLDVGEVVKAAVDRVRRRGQDHVFEVDLQPLFMVGDDVSLSAAVVNLLDNAVKWSPAGGTIQVQLAGNRLRVSDEGPGIPDADLPYVFDRFFRGETGRSTPGTGLGLSIVAKTVEDHGGSACAGRAASGGAEFTLQLPGVTSREALPRLPHRSQARLEAARSVEATALGAAMVAQRAVLTAAVTTSAAAVVAKQARAAATTETARAMAETVRRQALAVQGQADAAAREVAEAAARAASRVHSAVLPGQEAEARRAAVLVAQTATEAATAIAAYIALVAEAAARAAAAAALYAAAEAADAARLVELEVYSTAQAVQDTAAAAATQVAAQTHPPA